VGGRGPDLPTIQHHHIAMRMLTLSASPPRPPFQDTLTDDEMGEDICVSFVPHDRSFLFVGGLETGTYTQQPPPQSDEPATYPLPHAFIV